MMKTIGYPILATQSWKRTLTSRGHLPCPAAKGILSLTTFVNFQKKMFVYWWANSFKCWWYEGSEMLMIWFCHVEHLQWAHIFHDNVFCWWDFKWYGLLISMVSRLRKQVLHMNKLHLCIQDFMLTRSWLQKLWALSCWKLYVYKKIYWYKN